MNARFRQPKTWTMLLAVMLLASASACSLSHDSSGAASSSDHAMAEQPATHPMAIDQSSADRAAVEQGSRDRATLDRTAAHQTADDQASSDASSSVVRAVFTSQVVDREPVDQLGSVAHGPEGTDEVFFFTELRGLQGHQVTHRWEYEGEIMAEITFPIDGPRWRVYSSKKLMPQWTGEWTVKVIDQNGTELGASTVEYTQALAAMQ